MKEGIQYQRDLAILQGTGEPWETLCSRVRNLREERFGALKRNMETPNCVDTNYFITIGYMIAMDDLHYEFTQEAVTDGKDESETQDE